MPTVQILDYAPSLGASMPRARLIALLEATGARPVILAAPSGYGKTVVAAQYVEHASLPTIWIDARQVALSGVTILGYLLSRIAPEVAVQCGADCPFESLIESCQVALVSMSNAGVCLVLDDLGFGSEEALREVDLLSQALAPLGLKVVITMQAMDSIPYDMYQRSVVLGSAELRLNEEEARELASGRNLAPESVKSLLEATQGQVALYTLMCASWRGEIVNRSPYSTLRRHLGHVVRHQLDDSGRNLLCVMCLALEGNDALLQRGCVDFSPADWRRLAEAIPLVSLDLDGTGARTFRVHDLLRDYVFEEELVTEVLSHDSISRVWQTLDEHGALGRAAEVLLRFGTSDEVVDWIGLRGDQLLEMGHLNLLNELLDRVEPRSQLSNPRILVIGAQSALECHNYEEALAKANAVRALCASARDVTVRMKAVSVLVRASRAIGKMDEAAAFADILAQECKDIGSETAAIEAFVALGCSSLCTGDYERASSALGHAMEIARRTGCDDRSARLAEQSAAILPALARGDFVESGRLLAIQLDMPKLWLGDRIVLRGNLALCLVESGRIHRAKPLAESAVGLSRAHGLPSFVGSYLPVFGALRVAEGHVDGLASIQEGIRKSVDIGDFREAAANRVYESIVLRQAGRLDESLVAAERAYEHLSRKDNLGLCRAAALEVAASLLAIDDRLAASAWLEIAGNSGIYVNAYHATRAAMISSQMHIVAGNHRAAADLLLEHREHILSGNSNWQIAMYIRAFPELLGAFALAIEPAELPAHMLQMILPEHAERSLLATRAWLPAETWREIGVRLLGAADFATFVERDGRPLCRVRLFGGLEVNVGGRIIRERDWKKRKARLLFAMLVTRHGNDVARDQVFDHLWPEMDEERAKNNLYVAWSAMKAALMGGEPGRCPYVESVGGVCRVVSENVRSDVDEFDSAVAAADVARKVGDVSAELAAYRRISDAYRGDLLPGDVYDDWFAQLRGQYRVAFCDAMVHAAELSIDADKPVEGAAYVRRAIQADPLREDLYQMALRCQIASGQRSGAIETYQQCRTRLSEDLGLDPSVETRALYDRILAMEERPGGYARELLED